MPYDDRNWFIAERSQALASLLFTSTPDVTVQSEASNGDGVDIVAAVNDAENPPTRLFVVQVKGTMSADRAQWMETVKPLYKTTGLHLPTCVVVVNVQSKAAVYAWVAEPRVESNSVKLMFFEQPDFHPLDRDAVNQIVDRVRQWYEAIPHSMVPQAS